MKDNVNYLKFTTNGTNRHEQQGNMKTKVRGVCLVRGLFSLLCATAVLFTACFNFDERPEEFGDEFVAVENIHGVVTRHQPYTVIILSATVMPADATEKTIEWSIKADGGTNSELKVNRLTANGEGTVTVTATIKDGLGEGEDYTQDFPIVISLSETYAVREIFGIPRVLPVGSHTFTLEGRVAPDNAAYQEIVWSVVDAGTTGADISGNTLTVTAKGTLTIRATIKDGLLEKGDYTQDFKIFIPRTGVYVAGNVGVGIGVWEDGERTDLPFPVVPYSSQTTGIVYANGNQYVAGWYYANIADYNNRRSVPCYWVNGERKTLTTAVSGDYAYISTVSIAVDPVTSEVYILGGDYTDYRQNKFCYWKVDENGVVGARKDLPPPSTSSLNVSYPNLMTAYNGNVYIAFRTDWFTDTNWNYYWDKDGTVHPITVNGYDSIDITIKCITILNGTLYFAGSYDGPFCFSENGDVLNLDNSGIDGADVQSMVVQDGALVLYGDGYDVRSVYQGYSWNASGTRTTLPESTSNYLMDRVVFSDGDVYISMDSIGGYSFIPGGYIVFPEGKMEEAGHFIALEGLGIISGIAFN